jgi:hypothetical protein
LDLSRIDNDCGAVRGCFHGFVASRSKTDTFKTYDSGTFCIRVKKELVHAGVENTPGVGWRILVTDSSGITNSFFTDQQGTTGSQICKLAPGSYSVEEETSKKGPASGAFQLHENATRTNRQAATAVNCQFFGRITASMA